MSLDLYLAEISNDGNISKIYQEEYDEDNDLIIQTELNKEDNDIYTSNIYEKGFFKMEINILNTENKLDQFPEDYQVNTYIPSFFNYFLFKQDISYLKTNEDRDNNEEDNEDDKERLTDIVKNLTFLIPNKIFYDSEKDNSNDIIINFINKLDKEINLKLTSEQKKNIYINLIKLLNVIGNKIDLSKIFGVTIDTEYISSILNSIVIPVKLKVGLYKYFKTTDLEEKNRYIKVLVNVLSKKIYCIDLSEPDKVNELEYGKVIDIDCNKVNNNIVNKIFAFLLGLSPNQLYLTIGLVVLLIVIIIFMMRRGSDNYDDSDDYEDDY
mgnify:CR=1 FL=1